MGTEIIPALGFEPLTLAFQMKHGYFEIHAVGQDGVVDGFDYSIFDHSYHLIDGGCFDVVGFYDLPNVSIYLALDELLLDTDFHWAERSEDLQAISYDELMDKAEAVLMAMEKPSVMVQLEATKREQQTASIPKKEKAPKKDAEMER